MKIATIATLPTQPPLTGRKGRDGMVNKLEYQPRTETEEKPLIRLNDFAEISIGGVVYRVKSVFADKGQMGNLLDLAVMEKINRIA